MVSSMNHASSPWHSGGVLEPSWVPASNKSQKINAYHTSSCTRTRAVDIAARKIDVFFFVARLRMAGITITPFMLPV